MKWKLHDLVTSAVGKAAGREAANTVQEDAGEQLGVTGEKQQSAGGEGVLDKRLAGLEHLHTKCRCIEV
eukprot:2036045-Rhodomonas_salina.2